MNLNKRFSRRQFAKSAMAWTGLLFVPKHLVEGAIVPMTSRMPLVAAGGGGGGGGLTIATIDTQTGAHGASGAQVLTHSLTGVAAGALLVITAANEGDAGTGGSISVSGGGLTWTSQAEATASSSGNARIYTAVFTAGGSITITVTNATVSVTKPASSSVCYVITGQEGTLGGASPTPLTAANQPNISVTTTRVNSVILCACSDWAARAGTPTARLGTISLNHDVTTSAYRGVHIYHTATTATAYGMGYTGANTGGSNACGVVAYEVRTP
jgi:hypothetical protein